MKTSAIFLAALAVSMPNVVNAQDVGQFDFDRRSETRAMIGISIPFGGAETRRADMQPRVDLRVQRAQHGWNDSDRNASLLPFPHRYNEREARVSLTFEDSPRLLLQGRETGLNFGANANAEGSPLGETALWIGGALIVSAGIVLYIVEDVKDAGDDLIGPAD